MRETGIERILVGLDGSDSSRAALDWAISLARGMEAELVAVYVTRPTVSRDPESGPTPSYDL
ncbi:MAG: universal stress protein, partial [Candidatus Dormibacteraeota bacterium]|nr:universal stress protein [Candidatus Dormibacteraeota bacterium]